MRFEDMSPKARVFASPSTRSSPKESVTKVAAYRLRRVASMGDEGWWFVVRASDLPVSTRQSRMRVSPTCAVISVAGDAGCQKGVGEGVEISAMEAVLPPWKRVLPPIGAESILVRFWEAGLEGCERMSLSFKGRSDITGSSTEERPFSGLRFEACAEVKSRSAWRKA